MFCQKPGLRTNYFLNEDAYFFFFLIPTSSDFLTTIYGLACLQRRTSSSKSDRCLHNIEPCRSVDCDLSSRRRSLAPDRQLVAAAGIWWASEYATADDFMMQPQHKAGEHIASSSTVCFIQLLFTPRFGPWAHAHDFAAQMGGMLCKFDLHRPFYATQTCHLL